MTQDDRDVLELLKTELDFIEQGGYGRSVRTHACSAVIRKRRNGCCKTHSRLCNIAGSNTNSCRRCRFL